MCAPNLLAAYGARSREILGTLLVLLDDALIAARRVVARQLTSKGSQAMNASPIVAARAYENILAGRVAGAGPLFGAVLSFQCNRPIAPHAASRRRSASQTSVAGATERKLAVDTGEFRLLLAITDDGIGAAGVSDLARGQTFWVLALVKGASGTTAPLDMKLGVPATKLFDTVDRASSRALMSASVTVAGLRTVARQSLAGVVASAAAFARFLDVLGIDAHEVAGVVQAATGRASARISFLRATREHDGAENQDPG